MKIRVRGWHTGQKKMFSPEEMAVDQLSLLPTGEFVNINSTSTRLSTIYPTDKFIPLLSTGLHDKNGKEIFEGDIVESWQGSCGHIKIINTVCYENGLLLPFYSMEAHDHDLWNYEVENFEYEVIGNVYEHQHLLNREEKKS